MMPHELNASGKSQLARICGKCQAILTKANAGDLGILQPACNDCTNKHESECTHKFVSSKKLAGKICLLCGYLEKLF